MPKKIYVEKAFTLQHEGRKHEFPVGNHTVAPEIAEHWYVQAHIGQEPAAGGEGDADLAEQRKTLESAAQVLDGRADQLTKLQDDLAQREKAADQLKKDLQTGFEELRTLKAEVEGRVQAADQRETDLNARAEALDAREVTIAEREKAMEAAAKQPGKK